MTRGARMAASLLLCLVSSAAGAAPDLPAVSASLLLDAEGVRVEVAGRPFARYRIAAPDGTPVLRPFLHPVFAADGTLVTADQAETGGDHPHHRGIWSGHGNVNGADHWETREGTPGAPRQRPAGPPIRIDRDTLIHELVWDGPDGKPALLETRTLRFRQELDGVRIVDWTADFRPAKGPVTLGETKEAGLVAVRVAPAISASPAVAASSGCAGEAACGGRPADWCGISASLGGTVYGVAVLDHPENPTFPSRWHVRAYGLLAANPFGLSAVDGAPPGAGALTIRPGERAVFRHRIVVYRGSAAAPELQARADRFAGEPGPALVPIFDGRTFHGWRVPDPNPWWRIRDGVIAGFQDPEMRGHVLETTTGFRDVIVELEYRYVGDVDGGVFLRADRVWQCQIGISRSLKRDMTASIYDAKRGYVAEAARAPALNREGRWNRLRIEARGDRFRHWLNGELVLDYTDPAYRSWGPIGLQLHGGVPDMRIEFRNLRALRL